ncbi:MAG: metallophosphoesterase [Treponema sp.]|nr:metallophosphoesterase [Treponema sp.]
MKIAVVSDIHQSAHWRKLINHAADFDKIIFLGDEFDCWTNKWPLQMDNAENIITFKKSYPGKIDLCWSNHAISYFLDERCSGYQSNHAAGIEEFYKKNKEFYNVIYIYDKWIFSHGGVSAKWMKSCGINELNEINQLFKDKPNFFKWVGPDGYGNNPKEGPLWIRTEALINNYVQGYNQIAGHTENLQPRIVKKYKQIFVFCDTPGHNYLTVIDTKTNDVEFVNLK